MCKTVLFDRHKQVYYSYFLSAVTLFIPAERSPLPLSGSGFMLKRGGSLSRAVDSCSKGVAPSLRQWVRAQREWLPLSNSGFMLKKSGSLSQAVDSCSKGVDPSLRQWIHAQKGWIPLSGSGFMLKRGGSLSRAVDSCSKGRGIPLSGSGFRSGNARYVVCRLIVHH
jgi:hypothetical protein